MNELKTKSETAASSRIAYWGTLIKAVVLLLASFATVYLLLSNASSAGSARGMFTFITVALGVVTAGLNLSSIFLTFRGRQGLGYRLTFVSLALFTVIATSLLQGRTLSITFFTLIFAFIGIVWLSPHESRRLYAAATVAVIALAWLVDWMNPSWRIDYSGTSIGFTMIGVVTLIFIGLALYFYRETIAASVRLKIMIWMGVILVVLSAALTITAITITQETAISNAQAEASAITEAQAGNVKSKMEPTLDAARTLAYSFSIVKDPRNPVQLTREQVNGMLRKVSEENPAFLGTWTAWEPNAFDGLDAQYVNAPLHDETGRLIVYWARNRAGQVEGAVGVDYDTPGLNDWYVIPKETKQETVIPPYFYEIDNENVLLTSFAVPIVVDGRFYGIAGADLNINFVQDIVNEISLYDGEAISVLITDTGSLVAVQNQPELTLQSADTLYPDLEQLLPRIAAGESFSSFSPDGQYLRVFSPLYLGNIPNPWSFGLIIPLSEVTATATDLALRQSVIGIVLILLALVLLWFLSGQIARPLQQLTGVANAITQGNLNANADVRSTDETGVLANAFNVMTRQLRDFIESLEERVASRTRNLELAAEVGRTVSQVRALDVMLTDAAELIRRQFDLYYVQVYLVDPSQTHLTLEAGTGEVGRLLLERKHHLQLDTNSLNGRAAIEKKSVVIADTSKSAVFKPNPLLPETRSEMAVPLLVGGRVVGVLDMQSAQGGALDEDALPAFEALAGQIAIAIQNANFLSEVEEARKEVEKQAARLSRENYREFLDAINRAEETGFVFEGDTVAPLTEEVTASDNALVAPIAVTGEEIGKLAVEIEGQSHTSKAEALLNTVARQVAQQIENLRLLETAERFRAASEEASRRLTREGWEDYAKQSKEQLGYMYDLKEVTPVNGSDFHAALDVPLTVRNEVIGKLAVQDLDANDPEAVALVQTVAERLSAHIESLRQFDETRRSQVELDRRAQQLAAVAEISTISSQELDIQKMLESVVFLTQRKFGLYHAHVFLFDERSQMLAIRACGWKEGDEHEGTHGTTTIPLEQEQSLVARAARTRQAVIVNNVRNEPGWLPNPLLPDTHAELAVPLIVGDQLLGVLDVQSDKVDAFTQEDANIQATLAAQVATALQNARTFTQAQRQAERESALNTISQKIQSATTVEAVLQIAARELGHVLGAPMTIAQLSMKDK